MSKETSGLKLTKNQSVVLETLLEADKPLGAYDILEEVRDFGLKGPPQIYRALDKLMLLGIVHRIESLNAFVACDHGPHDAPAAFVICRSCETTVELSVSELEKLVPKDALPKDFVVDEVKLEIKGRCFECGSTTAVKS